MNWTEVLIIGGATLLGPILAVQAQKFIERTGEHRRRKLDIFYRLMAYRATHLAPDRVQALNMIDLEFRPNRFGYQSPRAKAVTVAWKLLLDELNEGIGENTTDRAAIEAWHRRCDDLSNDLLEALSRALGFRFTKVELRRGMYHPRGHVEQELAQRAIISNLNKILAGERPLAMKITEAPGTPEAAKLQAQLAEKMATAYGDDGALKVRIIEEQIRSRRPRST